MIILLPSSSDHKRQASSTSFSSSYKNFNLEMTTRYYCSCLLFLGDQLRDIHIMAPGAYHRARWMAKVIYNLKIYLFQSQFRRTAAELSRLQQFNAFTVQL